MIVQHVLSAPEVLVPVVPLKRKLARVRFLFGLALLQEGVEDDLQEVVLRDEHFCL